jgi:hypothetical protein
MIFGGPRRAVYLKNINTPRHPSSTAIESMNVPNAVIERVDLGMIVMSSKSGRYLRTRVAIDRLWKYPCIIIVEMMPNRNDHAR